MSLTFSFVLSVIFFLGKFTRAALTFSESDLLDFLRPQRALWHLISEFGEREILEFAVQEILEFGMLDP